MRGGLGFVEDFDGLEFFTFEHGEACATSGTDVGDGVSEAELFDGRCAITAADDADGIAIGDCFCDGFCTGIEGWHFEDTHGSVPDDGLGGFDDVGVALCGLWTDV